MTSKIKHASALRMKKRLKEKGGTGKKEKGKRGEKEEGGRKTCAECLRWKNRASKIKPAYPSALAGYWVDSVDRDGAAHCLPHGCRRAAFLCQPVVISAYGEQHVSAVEHCLVSVHKLLGDARRRAVLFDAANDGNAVGFSKHTLICELTEQPVFLPAAVLPNERDKDMACAADVMPRVEGGLVCALCASGAQLDGIKRKAVLPGDVGERLLDEMLERFV